MSIPTEAQNYQRKYAWDKAQLKNALQILRNLVKDYGLYFDCIEHTSMQESYEKYMDDHYRLSKPENKVKNK